MGLSQAELGSPYYTRAYISAVELGKVTASEAALTRIASRLGLPANTVNQPAEQLTLGSLQAASTALDLVSRARLVAAERDRQALLAAEFALTGTIRALRRPKR